jgi:hypothetical protein
VLRRSNRWEEFLDLFFQKHVCLNLFFCLFENYLAPQIATTLHRLCPCHNRKQRISDFHRNWSETALTNSRLSTAWSWKYWTQLTSRGSNLSIVLPRIDLGRGTGRHLPFVKGSTQLQWGARVAGREDIANDLAHHHLSMCVVVVLATLAQRLRQEAIENRGVVISSLMIGAFARKPHED